MDDDLIHNLAADGFHVIDRCLDHAATRDLIAGLSAAGNDPTELMLGGTAVREKRGVRFAQRNLLSLDAVRRFAASEPVADLVQRINPGAIPVRAILFDKTGDANWTVPWHQDRSIAVAEKIDAPGYGPWSVKAGVIHVQPPIEVLRLMVTLRFSLDACGVENGPLRVIPSTHERILTTAEIGKHVRDGRESICTTAGGGVVVMRPLLLHASSPARVVGHRRVLHIEFGPRELPGGLRWAMA